MTFSENIKTIKGKVKKLEEEEIHFFKHNEQRKKITYQIEEIESNYLYKDLDNVNEIKISLRLLEDSKNYYIKNKEYTTLKQKEDELTKKYNDIKQYNNNEKEITHDNMK